jgi:hypothetical protein
MMRGVPAWRHDDLHPRRSSERMQGILLTLLNRENPHGQQEHDLPLV